MNNKKIYIETMTTFQTSYNGLRKLENALGNIVLDCDLTEYIDTTDKLSAYILGLENPCDAYYEYFWELTTAGKCIITEDNHTYIINSWSEFYDYWTEYKERNNA